MITLFNLNGDLRLDLFDDLLLEQADQLHIVIQAAAETHSAMIESTHFLIALLRIEGGTAQKFLTRTGLGIPALQQGLATCARTQNNVPSPQQLIASVMDDSAHAMLGELQKTLLAKPGRITESQLLLATLKHLTPAAQKNFERIEYPATRMIQELESMIDVSSKAIDPFQTDSYSAGGRRVIELSRTEAESLGYKEIDPRHLLLGLIEYEGGATQTSIYQQGLTPKKLQERVMLNVRSHASRQRTQLGTGRQAFSESAAKILELAARRAGASTPGCRIYEAHLWLAFLQTNSFALQLLEDIPVDLNMARESAAHFRPEDEPAGQDAAPLRNWDQIKQDLEQALVGQQAAVDLCLPYIRRSLFGLKRPGKPAAVFLFCGPSGVGKTEMAKATARAVFGSEDSLIMLEMGQFQTKESMNIFVGAPPGYVGYGDGKLTNGLRDKPRAVVLFDEVEKAHPEVFDALLRFIDEGRIDDPAGPVRDGSECIIIMTSNVRTDSLQEMAESNYKRNKWEIRRRLREALLRLEVERGGEQASREPFRFRVEFLNRIDEVILFRALNAENMTRIARRYLEDYQDRLRTEKQIEITYSPSLDGAAWLIGRFCNSLSEGARAILRISQAQVIDPVIDFVQTQNCEGPVSLVVHLMGDPTHIDEPVSIVGYRNPAPEKAVE